jgi:4-diphosphocytidyl-2-C-methyl-D-erythritol kinase
MPGSLVVYAHAKINLGLEVLGKRPDGLHEVATILQSIDLADRLVFTAADDLVLRCQDMPTDTDNLILRAARLLGDYSKQAWGAHILCVKRVPAAAGLGGGSADAAATLRALSTLWDCQIAQDELSQLAGQLGADVPFALHGGTALATGSGRDLTRLPDAPPTWVVLVPLSAAEGDKTHQMYAQLRPADFTDGSRVQRLAAAIQVGPFDTPAIHNAFLRPALGCWPEVSGAIQALESGGADAVSLSGAGPSVFGLFRSRAAAARGCDAVRTAGLRALRCHFVASTRVSGAR